MGLTLHEQFIATAKAFLLEDNRFIGLLAGGSMIEGNMDEFSDLDLVLVYDVQYREAIMNERIPIAESLGHLLSGFTGEHVGEPRLIICLYGPPPLHVDIKFVTLTELEQRVENPLILWERDTQVTQVYNKTVPSYPDPDIQGIEDRFWVWVHYGAAKLGRGELFELIDHITYIRGAVLGPLLLKLNGQSYSGVRKLEFLAAEYTAELRDTVPLHTFDSCYFSLNKTIQLYRRLRACFPNVTIKSEAESAAVDYLHQIFADRTTS